VDEYFAPEQQQQASGGKQDKNAIHYIQSQYARCDYGGGGMISSLDISLVRSNSSQGPPPTTADRRYWLVR